MSTLNINAQAARRQKINLISTDGVLQMLMRMTRSKDIRGILKIERRSRRNIVIGFCKTWRAFVVPQGIPRKAKGLTIIVSPCCIWWPLLGLNQRPSDYESPALTTELRGRGRRGL